MNAETIANDDAVMKMMDHDIYFNARIPQLLTFPEFKLEPDLDGLTYNGMYMEWIYQFNRFPREKTDEEYGTNVYAIIAGWYFRHRKNGGEQNQIGEKLLRDYFARNVKDHCSDTN